MSIRSVLSYWKYKGSSLCCRVLLFKSHYSNRLQLLQLLSTREYFSLTMESFNFNFIFLQFLIFVPLVSLYTAHLVFTAQVHRVDFLVLLLKILQRIVQSIQPRKICGKCVNPHPFPFNVSFDICDFIILLLILVPLEVTAHLQA